MERHLRGNNMTKEKTWDEIREGVSEGFHNAWEYWSRAIAYKLRDIKIELIEGEGKEYAAGALQGLIHRWGKNWKPYKELDEETKEFDRVWADKILDNLPFKCPVYQCGGIMVPEERELPKDFIESEHHDGDEQTPDLVCDNCGAVYQFKKFKENKEVN